MRVSDIRKEFIRKLCNNEYVTDKTGVNTLEIMGGTFIADEPAIFGEVNWDYVQREIAWYESCSLNVYDMPGGVKQETNPPQIWMTVADKDGFINSNYGWCIFSPENGNQYSKCIEALKNDPDTRRAIMIYTRPEMQVDYNKNGRSDFMCTNAVQYLQRDGQVNAIVQMRSNDGWAGYKNDRAWQDYVLDMVANETGYQKGDIYWNAGSLHFYQQKFYLIDHCAKTGEISIPKKKYVELYPDSPFI